MKIDELVEKNSAWKLIDELSRKQGITEIMINGTNNIYIERDGEFIRLNSTLKREDIYSFCKDVALFNKKPYDSHSPIIDGKLPDGSRVNIISSLYTTGTPAITIRKYLKSIRTFTQSPGLFGLNDEKWSIFFQNLVKAKFNIIVSGGTGTGKTTFLNLLMQEVPKMERVITIEDTRELQFNLSNVIRLESKSGAELLKGGLDTRALLKNTLRMRPDRIIIGEVRSEETFDLLQAMNTGHNGSMTSLHSSSPADCITRLENLFLLAGYDIPVRAIRQQISSAIDFIIQIGKNKEGARVVTQVSEVTGIEEEKVSLMDIGRYDEDKKELLFSGLVPSQMKRFIDIGMEANFFDSNS